LLWRVVEEAPREKKMPKLTLLVFCLLFASVNGTHFRFSTFGVKETSCVGDGSQGGANPKLQFFGYDDVAVVSGSALAFQYEPVSLKAFVTTSEGVPITLYGENFGKKVGGGFYSNTAAGASFGQAPGGGFYDNTVSGASLGDEQGEDCPFCETSLVSSLPPTKGRNIIILTVKNDGTEDAFGVAIAMYEASHGIAFDGGSEIGLRQVDVPAGAEVRVAFEHEFESRSRKGLNFAIKSVVKGGNSNTCDDHSQLNAEVLLSGSNTSYSLPCSNGGEEPIHVVTSMRCRRPGADEFGECPSSTSGGGGVGEVVQLEEVPSSELFGIAGLYLRSGGGGGGEVVQPAEGRGSLPKGQRRSAHPNALAANGDGNLTIPAGEEVYAKITASGLGPEGMEVMLVAQEVESGEIQHAILKLVPTTVPAVLNFPAQCCIKSVRTRVLLETQLASALEAYESGEVRKAVKLLRKFIEKATLLECELSSAEQDCLEQTLLMATDAARIMAEEELATAQARAELSEQGQRREVPSTELFGIAGNFLISRGDGFRAAGIFEAALLKWNTDRRCCSKGVETQETHTTCGCTHL